METTAPQSEDLLMIEQEYVRAEAGKRLANYLIDLVVFYVLAFGIAMVIAMVAPSAIEGIAADDGSFGLLDRIISLLFYALYMSTIEAITRGKSLGKYITGTRAVNLDGSRISAGSAFARGFSRAVPFCAFSAFGSPCNPWQDRWTDTMVIDERKTAEG